MAVPFLKVYHTHQGVERDITELISFDQQRGLEAKQNQCSFTVKNSAYRDKTGGELNFTEDDAIEVYVDYSPITKASSQLLLSGQIKKISPKMGESGSSLKITAADKTSLMLGALWSKTYASGDADNTAPEIIISAIQSSPVSTDVTTTNVATSTSTGAAFPDITPYAKTFKPLYDWISELSQPDYTGEDRAYIYYVDKDNDLHWFYPSQTSTGTIVEGVDNIINWSLEKSSDSIINMIIFNAGQDANGNGVLWYYYDTTSKSSQLRMKFQPMTDLSTGQNGLFDQEIAAGNLTETTSGEVPYKGKLYALVASGTTSWGVAFTGSSEYNSAFRTRLKNLGGERAAKITQRFGKLLWNGTVELKGTHDFVAGDLITFTSRTLGLSSYLLRVTDVQHTVSEQGWITSLQIKEDEEAITAS